tara:strand:- start:589 stop:1023 length:435 start_codon:yes stop_codon:yes gene_type:complete
MQPTVLVSIFSYLFLAAGANAAPVDALAGQWRTVRHGALVEITDCGDGTPCGALAWVDDTVSGGQLHDVRNREPDLRERPLIGLPILWGFLPDGDGWRDGRLYNPDDGKAFRADLQLLSSTRLRVTACLGPFCRRQIWTRSDNP